MTNSATEQHRHFVAVLWGCGRSTNPGPRAAVLPKLKLNEPSNDRRTRHHEVSLLQWVCDRPMNGLFRKDRRYINGWWSPAVMLKGQAEESKPCLALASTDGSTVYYPHWT